MKSIFNSEPDYTILFSRDDRKEHIWLLQETKGTFAGILKDIRNSFFFIKGQIANDVVRIHSYQFCTQGYEPKSTDKSLYEFSDPDKTLDKTQLQQKEAYQIRLAGNYREKSDKGMDEVPVACTLVRTFKE